MSSDAGFFLAIALVVIAYWTCQTVEKVHESQVNACDDVCVKICETVSVEGGRDEWIWR